MPAAPIALFTYNRLTHTRKTIDALRSNHLAAQSELFIFSDGPRTEADAPKVEAVRQYLATIDGFRRVQIEASPRNLGLAGSIVRGVTAVLKAHGCLIVLEDDMITSRFFLEYMNESLELYRDVANVASVHGYIYPMPEKLPETFFIRGADCWGWGTWKRAWDRFETDGTRLLGQLKRRNLGHEFDFSGTAGYLRMLKQQTMGRNDSWAVRWYASAFLQDMLTLYPGRSLVSNIGSDSSGEHCGTTDAYDVGDVTHNQVVVAVQPAVEDPGARAAFRSYFRSVARRKLARWGKSWLKRMTRFGGSG